MPNRLTNRTKAIRVVVVLLSVALALECVALIATIVELANGTGDVMHVVVGGVIALVSLALMVLYAGNLRRRIAARAADHAPTPAARENS